MHALKVQPLWDVNNDKTAHVRKCNPGEITLTVSAITRIGRQLPKNGIPGRQKNEMRNNAHAINANSALPTEYLKT